MAATLETISELERRVNLSATAAEINTATERRLKDWAKTIKLPGFRPGKVPLKMVGQQYGAQARSEAIQEVIDRAFSNAMQGSDVRIAGTPRVEAKEGTENSEQFDFTATFEVYPTVVLGDVAALEIERPQVSVTPADVDRTIETLRKQRVTYKNVDRAANTGDRLMVDFVGTIDGVAFQGGSAKQFPVIVGEGRMMPEFEAAMPGLAKGGSKTFDVAFPADYPGKEVAGKTAKFTVSASEVAEAVLPTVDAEFAKAFGVADGDLSKLRAEVQQNLELELKRRVFANTRDQVLKALREATPIAVPNALVNNEAQRMAQMAQEDMLSRGATKEQAQVSPAAFEAAARERVALGLIVAEAVRSHKLQASPEQVKKLLEEAAMSYEQPEQVVQWYRQEPQRMAEFEALALEANVVEWILSKAKVTDKVVDFAEIMGQTTA